ncbi:MAG TPA: hypothetical protein VJO53_05615 [Candidatus Acidoferrales bacterium]|nr:hypothetical protein [Candidatus Acidoferrales bacterium]
MLSATIWWAGILLGALILLRGLREKCLRKYPFFYVYSACVVGASLPGYFLYASNSTAYDAWYWGAQFVTLILGYGILLEILNNVLSAYPGAERFARISGLVALGAIACFAVVWPLVMPHTSSSTHAASAMMVEFERDLRTVQAIFICGLLGVASYYGIEIGKNMKGMILGYGLYILTSLMSLAVQAHAGTSFYQIWAVIQPLSYDVSLVVWLAALWSYQPNPIPDSTIRLESDYEAFVVRTRGAIGAMRSHLSKAARA